MAKIYFYRHQAAGVLHDMPFADPPTKAQCKALDALMLLKHGAHHKKELEKEPADRRPYWSQVVAVDLLDSSAVIAVPKQGGSVVNEAVAGSPVASGSVTVATA